MKNIEELVNKHWDYIESLLKTHSENIDLINIIKFHYIQAMIHGYKHGYKHGKNDNLGS